MVRAVNVRPAAMTATPGAQKNVRYVTATPVGAPTPTELPLAIHQTTGVLWSWSGTAWVQVTGAPGVQPVVIYGVVNPTTAPTAGQLPIYVNTLANLIWFYDTTDAVWIPASTNSGLTPIFGAGPPAAIPTATQLPYYTDTTNNKFYVFDSLEGVWIDVTAGEFVEAYLGGSSGGQNVLTTEQAVATFPVPALTWVTSRQISLRGHLSPVGSGGTARVRLDSATGPLLGVAAVNAAGLLDMTMFATAGGATGTLKAAGRVGNTAMALQTVTGTNLTVDRLLVLTAQGDGTNGVLNDFCGLVVG